MRVSTNCELLYLILNLHELGNRGFHLFLQWEGLAAQIDFVPKILPVYLRGCRLPLWEMARLDFVIKYSEIHGQQSVSILFMARGHVQIIVIIDCS
jgi:hypothetical protein